MSWSDRLSSGEGVLTWVLLAAALGAVYFGIMLVPSFVEAYEVKQVLREAGNMAVREQSDERIKAFVLEKCRTIGSHYEIRDGQEMNLPGIVLLDGDVVVNRDENAKTIIIQASYEKVVNFPFTAAQRQLSFSPAIKGDIATAKW